MAAIISISPRLCTACIYDDVGNESVTESAASPDYGLKRGSMPKAKSRKLKTSNGAGSIVKPEFTGGLGLGPGFGPTGAVSDDGPGSEYVAAD